MSANRISLYVIHGSHHCSIEQPYGRICEMSTHELDGEDYENHLHLFRNSPEGLTLAMRMHSELRPRGTKRNLLAISHLSKDEAIALRDTLNTLITELR